MANNSSSQVGSNIFMLFNSTESPSNSNGLESRVKLGIDITIFVVAVLGNLLVLVVIYTTRERRKTPFEILIANLSVTDILSVLVHFVYYYTDIPASKWYCKFSGGFFPSIQMVSVLIMTTIAMFRCRSIVHPFKTKPSTKFTYYTVVVLWLLANFCYTPIYLGREQFHDRCKEIWSSQLLNKIYTVSLAVVQYVIPSTIVAVSYIRIAMYLKQHRIPQSGLSSDRINQLKMTRKRDIEVLKISITIVILFNVSTLPGQIAWIDWIVFESYDMARVIFKFSRQLFLLHSCCNPFVYGTISREFRSRFVQVFWSVFCCMCKIRRNPAEVRLQTGQRPRKNATEDSAMLKGYVKRDESATVPNTQIL